MKSDESPGVASPVTVVLVTHYFPDHGGGIEIVAFELVRRLSACADFSFTWFASATAPPPELERLRCRPVRAWNGLEQRLGVPWPVWSPSCLGDLWHAIGAATAVHVHDGLYMGSILAAVIAAVRRKPLVVTQHVGLVPYRNPMLRGLMSVANRLIAAPMLRHAHSVGFVSEAVRSYYARLCRWKHPPEVVPNGVDTDLYRPPSTAERRDARDELQIGGDENVILFVGRFVEKKGLPLLERLVRAMPHATWMFAGEGPIDPDHWRLPNVRVYRDRKRESLRELLWAANLLVLPSVGEGFPLVVQEAIAAGLPCLVAPDTIAGYPISREVILSEPLGANAQERWAARLRRISSGGEPLPESERLAAFAKRHWSWQTAVGYYAREFMAIGRRTAASSPGY